MAYQGTPPRDNSSGDLKPGNGVKVAGPMDDAILEDILEKKAKLDQLLMGKGKPRMDDPI